MDPPSINQRKLQNNQLLGIATAGENSSLGSIQSEIMKWLRCFTNWSPHNVAVLQVKNLSYSEPTSGPSSLLPDPLRCKCLPSNSHCQRVTPATVLHDYRPYPLKRSNKVFYFKLCLLYGQCEKKNSMCP